MSFTTRHLRFLKLNRLTAPTLLTSPAIASDVGPDWDVSDTLTVTEGSYDNADTVTGSLYRDGSLITPDPGLNYVLVATDAGTEIEYRETASNAIGATYTTSNKQTVLPYFSVAASLDGGSDPATNGEVLTCLTGTLFGASTVTYYWLDTDGNPIAGETSNTYTIDTTETGDGVSCVVSASNAGGLTLSITPERSITLVTDWRTSVDGLLLNWRYGYGETTVSGNLDEWTDTVSANTASAPSSGQRPTLHADGDGWEFDSANTTALYTSIPDTQAAAIETANQFSVHARINPTTGSNQIIWSVAEGDTNQNQYAFRVSSAGTLQLSTRWWNGSSVLFDVISANTSLADGQNYNVGMTVETDDTVTFYVNGVNDGGGTKLYTAVNLNRFALGVMGRISPATYFDGKISEVLVSDTAHSASTVENIFYNLRDDYVKVTILDDVDTTHLKGAWSVNRKLFASYTGSLFRVGRSSDSSEIDIGFDSNGFVDSGSIITHCSGTDGHVVTVYDQSGLAHDITSGGDITYGPKIYDSVSGAIKLHNRLVMSPDNVDDGLSRADNLGITGEAGFDVFHTAQGTAESNTNVITLGQGGGAGEFIWIRDDVDASTGSTLSHRFNNGNSVWTTGLDLTTDIYTRHSRKEAGDGYGDHRYWVGNTELAQSSTGNPTNTLSLVDTGMNWMGNPGTAAIMGGYHSELIIFGILSGSVSGSAALSESDAEIVRKNINEFMGTL